MSDNNLKSKNQLKDGWTKKEWEEFNKDSEFFVKLYAEADNNAEEVVCEVWNKKR